MTDSKPDPKPRPSFLPIMLLIVVCAAVMLVLIPFVECENCYGVGKLTDKEMEIFVKRLPFCMRSDE